ncbi:MAG: bactofilin family protein [Pseudomonadota bacterium]
MFRRKKDDGDEPKIGLQTEGPASAEPGSGSSKPLMRPAAPTTTGAFGGPRSQIPGRPSTWGRDKPGSEVDVKKLIVGREISLSGQITSCDRLIVEGRVEASLSDSRMIDIAESGIFKGTAEIDNADIAGRFEGKLTVRERLFIRATGRVHGTIRYGQIEIEPGGEIAGDIQVVAAPSPVAPAAPAAPEPSEPDCVLVANQSPPV